jgi:hypothetical protein
LICRDCYSGTPIPSPTSENEGGWDDFGEGPSNKPGPSSGSGPSNEGPSNEGSSNPGPSNEGSSNNESSSSNEGPTIGEGTTSTNKNSILDYTFLFFAQLLSILSDVINILC